MGVFDKIKRAEIQSRDMAAQLGVELSASPDLTPGLEAANLRRRIFRCALCSHQDDCQKKLATGGLTEAPAYCRNKAEFDFRSNPGVA